MQKNGPDAALQAVEQLGQSGALPSNGLQARDCQGQMGQNRSISGPWHVWGTCRGLSGLTWSSAMRAQDQPVTRVGYESQDDALLPMDSGLYTGQQAGKSQGLRCFLFWIIFLG